MSGGSHSEEVPKRADGSGSIAIIGFSLKFPQADSPSSFKNLMTERICAMTEWPKDRMNLEAFFHRNESGAEKTFTPGAHFLTEDVGAFDASFFGISATEAVAIDPQQRILLETAYRALENAGITLKQASGSKTGVYSGSMADDYKQLLFKDPENMPKYTITGTANNFLSNRLSWFYNFKGPSVTIDSACSSSLEALHIACQGLREGDTDMALATGSSLMLAIENVVSLMQMGFLSPDGRCFSFDDRANGYSRGEGFGVVVLKRLEDAVRDNNVIRAVIRSTGSNQDGHTPGITQPNGESQATLIRETYRKAGLDFSSTRYFEAHGTGTSLGDPIEAGAIGSVFRASRSSNEPLFM